MSECRLQSGQSDWAIAMIIAGIYREQLFSYLYIHDEVTAYVDMIQLRVSRIEWEDQYL